MLAPVLCLSTGSSLSAARLSPHNIATCFHAALMGRVLLSIGMRFSVYGAEFFDLLQSFISKLDGILEIVVRQ